mgnify:CR=1 FL=1
MLAIVSTHMLGQYGFLAKVKELSTVSSAFCPWVGSIALPSFNALCLELTSVQVFSTFEDLGIYVDVVATSEVSISLTLDPSKL